MTEKLLLPVTKNLNHFLGSLVWVVTTLTSGTVSRVRDSNPPQPSIPHKLQMNYCSVTLRMPTALLLHYVRLSKGDSKEQDRQHHRQHSTNYTRCPGRFRIPANQFRSNLYHRTLHALKSNSLLSVSTPGDRDAAWHKFPSKLPCSCNATLTQQPYFLKSVFSPGRRNGEQRIG